MKPSAAGGAIDWRMSSATEPECASTADVRAVFAAVTAEDLVDAEDVDGVLRIHVRPGSQLEQLVRRSATVLGHYVGGKRD